jgi:hypothetical protein
MICEDCGESMPLDVYSSGRRGYWLGRSCSCGPYSRDSGYFKTEEEAQDKLDYYKRHEKKSEAHMRPLSVRHKRANIVSEIEKDQKIREDVRSLCEHSGGTKNTHSIISFLRDKLGKELVRYSDEDLVKYIEGIKKEYYEDQESPNVDVGRVGVDTEDHPEDNAADYITHGKGS